MHGRRVAPPERREDRHQGEAGPLVAGQPECQNGLGPEELAQCPVGQVREDIELDELTPPQPAAQEPGQDEGRAQMKGRLVELGRVAAEAVAEVHPPGQARGDPVAAARGEAAEPADRDRRRHGHREAVPRLDPDAQQRFRQLDARVAADEAEDDRLAVLEPDPAAEEAVPVGQREGQLGPDHRPAERTERDPEPLATAQAQRRLRPAAQEHPHRERGEHDQRVGTGGDPGHQSGSRLRV